MDDIEESKKLELEQRYVKLTYDNIAEDFSGTRYKKWPKIEKFLKSLTPSSLVLDVGCGNGKYLDNPTTFNIGCDISKNLLGICKIRGFEVVLCDMSRLPFRSEIFDTVLSVAALHHVVTSKRRQDCLNEMVNLMNPQQGKLLAQVWSYEQDLDKDNVYLKKNLAATNEKVTILDNIEIQLHKNRTKFQKQDLLVPFQSKKPSGTTNFDNSSEVHGNLRYYHVFKKGELDSMFNGIPQVAILEAYHDKGNWCVIAGKGFD